MAPPLEQRSVASEPSWVPVSAPASALEMELNSAPWLVLASVLQMALKSALCSVQLSDPETARPSEQHLVPPLVQLSEASAPS